jgi:hypothetical protein
MHFAAVPQGRSIKISLGNGFLRSQKDGANDEIGRCLKLFPKTMHILHQ